MIKQKAFKHDFFSFTKSEFWKALTGNLFSLMEHKFFIQFTLHFFWQQTLFCKIHYIIKNGIMRNKSLAINPGKFLKIFVFDTSNDS